MAKFKSLIIPVLVTFLLALFIWSLNQRLGQANFSSVPTDYKGELHLLEEGEFAVEADSEPIFSKNGRRVLIKNKTELKLWEEGLGLRSIYKGESLEAKLSSDATRVIFFADKDLYLWEEGIGLKELLAEKFHGDWSFSLSNAAEKILFYPKSKNAKFISEQGKTFSSPFLLKLSFISRANSEIKIASELLTKLAKAEHLELDGSSISSFSFQEGKKGFGYQRFSLKAPYQSFDLTGDKASDILVFGRGRTLPLWWSYTLDGKDGVRGRGNSNYGKVQVWRVGDNRGLPVPADYNGDGVLDLATFTPGLHSSWRDGEGNWQIFLSKSANQLDFSPTEEYKSVVWGAANDLPVPADYDGDGVTDLGVFDSESAKWHLLFSGGEFNKAKARLGIQKYGRIVKWGTKYGVPVVADYDGDGRSDLALWRKPPGKNKKAKWRIYYLPDADGKQRKSELIRFGIEGDIPTPADWNCDGKIELAVYRPKEAAWIIRLAGGKEERINWGISNAYPVPGDYDGDSCADAAFFSRTGPFRWYILGSKFTNEAREIMPSSVAVVTKIPHGHPEHLPVSLWLRNHYLRSAGGGMVAG